MDTDPPGSDEGVSAVAGETIHDLVNVVLMGDSGAVSSIDACIPVNGRFSGAMIVGDLPGGDYRLFASAGDSVVWKELTVDSQDLPAGTTLSDDGKTLLRFNGDVDVDQIVYRLSGVDYALVGTFVARFGQIERVGDLEELRHGCRAIAGHRPVRAFLQRS